jgi:hypothetical protein
MQRSRRQALLRSVLRAQTRSLAATANDRDRAQSLPKAVGANDDGGCPEVAHEWSGVARIGLTGA